MEDYALIFNSDVNFAHFRDLRRQRRNHDKPLRGNAMAYNMVRGSPLENYAGLISYIITFYDLVNLDEAELGSVNMFWKRKNSHAENYPDFVPCRQNGQLCLSSDR